MDSSSKKSQSMSLSCSETTNQTLLGINRARALLVFKTISTTTYEASSSKFRTLKISSLRSGICKKHFPSLQRKLYQRQTQKTCW